MSKLHDLADLGQSIWLDYIRRDMLQSGELNQLHQTGVRGVTSNPSIFEQAIARSDDYDAALERLLAEDLTAKEIYEALAIEDIQHACDIFMDLYRQSDGADGYVSLEANPRLAYETEATIAEARRLFAAVDRPNVYIKVPATPQGIPAIRQLISEGINVNVTLIFAVSAYDEVAEAYLSGLEALVDRGGNPSKVSSVASFFVSRVDSKVDKMLDKLDNNTLRGQIGIANAKVAYQRFLQIFSGARWEKLEARGAMVQRPLWGSTSTKDPAYPDTLYVDNLIGPHTVNTVPPETLEALLDHATVKRTLDQGADLAFRQLQELEALGISLEQVTDELLEEGVDKFAAAFDSLLQTIEAQQHDGATEQRNEPQWQISLGNLRNKVDETLETLNEARVLHRLWDRDHTLWADDPAEISNRLGWLDIAHRMEAKLPELQELASELRDSGYQQAVLLGMGGSSLAPELFANAFDSADGYLKLSVLDSTDPDAILDVKAKLDPETTVFVVSSKSGGTVETLSLFKYFHNWIADEQGEQQAGQHFVAITDEGSKLAKLAQELGFRTLLLNDPELGGRYSALSHFGLAPAALLGLDVAELLRRAQRISGPDDAQRALQLGAAMGRLAQEGRNKLTLITSAEIASFGDWVEQLIAESTGKEGKGILPIVGESLLPPEDYGDDRLFVYLRLAGGTHDDAAVERLVAAGHPVITIDLDSRYALGEQFMLWEVATAIAGHVMGIHPFNQPNVEAAKRKAKEMIAIYEERGSLPENITVVQGDGISVQDLVLPADSPAEALENFLDSAQSNGYVAVQAYVKPDPETDRALAGFRRYVAQRTGLAVTVGYGPRFLHSTGQLHKGDAGNGLFIQLVSQPQRDLPIPDEPGSEESTISFGTLKVAQALGDARALQEAGRRVIRFMFGGDTPDMLDRLLHSDEYSL